MTSQLLKNIQNIQSMIDENKSRLLDGVYVKLSDELLKHYEMIEKEVYECIYQAEVNVLWTNVHKTFYDNIKIEPKFKHDKILLELTKSQVERIQNNIINKGYHELEEEDEVSRVIIELSDPDGDGEPSPTDIRMARKVMVTSLSKY